MSKQESGKEGSQKQEAPKEAPKMIYNYLGNSGLKVSRMGYGNWVNSNDPEAQNKMTAMVKCAWDHGINFFDTAETYAKGQAERQMGIALAALNVPREQLVVSTKLFWGKKGGVNALGLSQKHIVEGMKHSLENLGMDYVDVVFCHRPDHFTGLHETCRAMNHLIEEGHTFYWGTSEWSAGWIRKAIEICD